MRKTVTAFVASLFCASAFAGLTQTEKDVFNTLVRDDINGAYNVYQTATFAMAAGGTNPIYQDVDVIEREFQSNELRANKKYKGKQVLIEGRIDEVRVKEALQKPSLILRPENFCLLHKLNFCANDCSGYF